MSLRGPAGAEATPARLKTTNMRRAEIATSSRLRRDSSR